MKVFKNYVKLLFREFKIPIIVYIIVFSFISIMNTSTSSKQADQIFDVEKINVSVIDNDNSTLSNGLIDYIKETCILTELNENDMKNLKDVVFYRKSNAILTIPEGFEKDFIGIQNLKIDKIALPDSSEVYLVELYINNFLKFTDMYIKQGYDIKHSLEEAKADLQKNIEVQMIDKNKQELGGFVLYYNYLPYPVIAILTLCVSAVLVYLNKIDIKRRNTISPVSLSSYNTQLLLGSVVIPVLIDIVFIGISLVIFKEDLFCMKGILVILNLLVMSFICLSMSFMISIIAKEKAISAISTVLSLGLCFLGGVFVPLEYLSSSVRKFAIINPIYWYTKANKLIGGTVNITSSEFNEFLYCLFIQLLFAAAFFAISLIVSKEKRVADNA